MYVCMTSHVDRLVTTLAQALTFIECIAYLCFVLFLRRWWSLTRVRCDIVCDYCIADVYIVLLSIDVVHGRKLVCVEVWRVACVCVCCL